MSDLTPIETARLENAEIVIADGLSGFIKVGKALADVQDGRLYRATHDTFEAYIKDRWNLERRRGYQLITAAKVAENVEDVCTNGSHLNERQARELAKVEPERQAEVLAKASEDGKPTAAKIREAAAEGVSNPDPLPVPDPDDIEDKPKTAFPDEPELKRDFEAIVESYLSIDDLIARLKPFLLPDASMFRLRDIIREWRSEH